MKGAPPQRSQIISSSILETIANWYWFECGSMYYYAESEWIAGYFECDNNIWMRLQNRCKIIWKMPKYIWPQYLIVREQQINKHLENCTNIFRHNSQYIPPQFWLQQYILAPSHTINSMGHTYKFYFENKKMQIWQKASFLLCDIFEFEAEVIYGRFIEQPSKIVQDAKWRLSLFMSTTIQLISYIHTKNASLKSYQL